MEVTLIKTSIEPEKGFYDGISLSEYEKLNSRWNEVLSIVHDEIFKYINDNSLCFDDDLNLFPTRSKLTGKYYIDRIAFIKRVNPIGFQIMVSTRLTETLANKEDDYLGLEVTLFTKSEDDILEVWGIDSSSI